MAEFSQSPLQRRGGATLAGRNSGTIRENQAAKDRAKQEAEKLRGVLDPVAASGLSLQEISKALAGAGKTTKTGAPYSPSQVSRPLSGLDLN